MWTLDWQSLKFQNYLFEKRNLLEWNCEHHGFHWPVSGWFLITYSFIRTVQGLSHHDTLAAMFAKIRKKASSTGLSTSCIFKTNDREYLVWKTLYLELNVWPFHFLPFLPRVAWWAACCAAILRFCSSCMSSSSCRRASSIFFFSSACCFFSWSNLACSCNETFERFR